jgi:hypothetical protein
MIWDPEKNLFRSLDPGFKKAPDFGSWIRIHNTLSCMIIARLNLPLLQQFVKNIKLFLFTCREDEKRQYQVVQVGEDLANPGSSLHFQSSHFNNQVRVPGGAGGGGPCQPRLKPILSVQSL